MNVFLDLEDTIIRSWDDPFLCNVGKIKGKLDEIFSSQDPSCRTVGIFSFAIWDAKDVSLFVDRRLKETIERALDVRITEFPSIEEMSYSIMAFTGLRFEGPLDLIQILGKHLSFSWWCQAKLTPGEFLLIDDAVPNQTLTDHDKNIIIHTLNVNKL